MDLSATMDKDEGKLLEFIPSSIDGGVGKNGIVTFSPSSSSIQLWMDCNNSRDINCYLNNLDPTPVHCI